MIRSSVSGEAMDALQRNRSNGILPFQASRSTQLRYNNTFLGIIGTRLVDLTFLGCGPAPAFSFSPAPDAYPDR